MLKFVTVCVTVLGVEKVANNYSILTTKIKIKNVQHKVTVRQGEIITEGVHIRSNIRHLQAINLKGTK